VRAILITALLFLGSARVAPEPSPPPGTPTVVRTTPPAIVWIGDGRYVRGSTEDVVAHAVELCRRTVRGAQAQMMCHPENFRDETPPQRVYVSAFGIDRTEVTVAAYRRCVTAGFCTPSTISAEDERLALPEHPVTGVDFRQASGYCAFIGGRLPTEAEWERAARGDDGRRFPWGDHYNDRLANHGHFDLENVVDGYRHAAPVGSFPDAASPFGVLDMAGNAFEWTADLYAPDTYSRTSTVDPRGVTSGGQRVVRGGSWRWPAFMMRTTHRFYYGDGHEAPDLGFRCAYDAAR